MGEAPRTPDWYGLGVMVWDGGASWGHSGTIEGGRAIVEHDADGTTLGDHGERHEATSR